MNVKRKVRAKRTARVNGRAPSGRITSSQGQALLDRAAQALGMTSATFVRRWRQGRIPDPDRPEVLRAVALLPFAR